MAIVRMKKLRALAMRDQRDALMEALLRLGCVEVHGPEGMLSDPDTAAILHPEQADVVAARNRLGELEAALKVLQRYAPEKKKLLSALPQVKLADFLSDETLQDDLALARQLNDLERQLRRQRLEEGRLREEMESLQSWEALELDLNSPGTKTCAVGFYSAPSEMDMESVADAAETVTEEVQIILVSSDELQRCFIVIALRRDMDAIADALRAAGCTAVTFPGMTGTARENIDARQEQLALLDVQRRELTEKITREKDRAADLRLSADRLAAAVARAEAAERLQGTDNIIALEGWCPAPECDKLAACLGQFDCAWEFSDPVAEEYPDVPVQLQNGKLTAPMNMVTEMYSLPAYDGIDPNPLMAPFFILFYGMMMADMGYGLLMMLVSWIVVKKARPRGPATRHMFPLIGLCGVSTFLFGAITGSFFGDLLPQLAKTIDPNTTFTAMPALFSPLDDALAVLVGSLALGVVQIFTGMGVSAWKKFKDGNKMDAIFDEGTWYVILLGLVPAILSVTPAVLILGGVMLVVGSGYKAAKAGGGPVKIALGTLVGVGGSLYNNVTGYFSDILSYSRLMALMLAGAVISQVFNTLGAITGNVILLLIISMVGNALNFALNLLGCFVHDMRLQCLEFFSRFYADGGRPFRPLKMQTKFVDIVKE